MAWGARGRVFESLRPDHINQGVARFYLATPFYFIAFLPLQNDWLLVESARILRTPIGAFPVLFWDWWLRFSGLPLGY